MELVKAGSQWALAGCSVSLSKSHDNNLEAKDSEDGLSVDEARVSEVVESSLLEDQSSSLEPWHAVGLLEKLRDDASQSSQHSPSSVDKLCENQIRISRLLFFSTKEKSRPATNHSVDGSTHFPG